LENELIYLSPRNFETLQDYFSKFNTLLQQAKACGIDRKEEQLILSILSKLGPEYSVFISSFHTTRISMGKYWKIPSMDDFIESLIHEKNKLIHMGALRRSKAHALVVQDDSKKNK
jgi:hypothetical protein